MDANNKKKNLKTNKTKKWHGHHQTIFVHRIIMKEVPFFALLCRRQKIEATFIVCIFFSVGILVQISKNNKYQPVIKREYLPTVYCWYPVRIWCSLMSACWLRMDLGTLHDEILHQELQNHLGWKKPLLSWSAAIYLTLQVHHHTMSLNVTSTHLLNIPRSRGSTTSLGYLFQCLTTFPWINSSWYPI